MILVLWKCCSALIVTVSRIGKPFSPIAFTRQPTSTTGHQLETGICRHPRRPGFFVYLSMRPPRHVCQHVNWTPFWTTHPPYLSLKQ